MFDQAAFDVRCEWGIEGALKLAPISDVVIIVDILSFSTSVEIASTNGAIIFPYPYRDDAVEEFARNHGAIVAERDRSKEGFSLSPASLKNIPSGYKLVLPSPNGATISFAAGETPVIAGSLRNAKAVAKHAATFGKKIAVIPCGERWPNGSLRPSFEDLIGAGAIIAQLSGRQSPEAKSAMAAFCAVSQTIVDALLECGSGKELVERSYTEDVLLAAELNVSQTVPILMNGSYRAVQPVANT
jgi:2-phosphosulfolactate phosphatase